MEPLVPAREEGAGPDPLGGSAGGVFRSQEFCSETEAENGRVSNQPELWGHAVWEDAAGGGSSRRRAEGGESESELSLEVWSEAGSPAIRIWCFMPDKAGDYVFGAPPPRLSWGHCGGVVGAGRGGECWTKCSVNAVEKRRRASRDRS